MTALIMVIFVILLMIAVPIGIASALRPCCRLC